MQIQLNQTNIEEALRDFISKQGINLRGRTVDVTFTQGRRGRGLTAELDISDAEDFEIPGFTDVPETPEKAAKPVPHLQTVKANPAEQKDTPAWQEDEPKEPEDVVEEQPEAKPSTTSLFGS